MYDDLKNVKTNVTHFDPKHAVRVRIRDAKWCRPMSNDAENIGLTFN